MDLLLLIDFMVLQHPLQVAFFFQPLARKLDQILPCIIFISIIVTLTKASEYDQNCTDEKLGPFFEKVPSHDNVSQLYSTICESDKSSTEHTPETRFNAVSFASSR